MDTTTPTMSIDEESGTQLPTTTHKQEPSIATDKQLDDVVAVAVAIPSPITDKPKKMTRRLNFATLFFLGVVLAGLLVAAITIPIVKNNQHSTTTTTTAGLSAAAPEGGDGTTTTTTTAGLSAAAPEGGDEAAEEPAFILDPSLPNGSTPTLVDGITAPVAGNTPTLTGSSYEPLWKGVSDSIGFYDESVVQGYADTADFQADLTAVAKMMVNLIVARSIGDKYQYYYGGPVPAMGGNRPQESKADDTMMAAPAMPSVGNGVNDFGSNNQEESVEEGDKIVSDGKRVFASYGDYIIAWDVATGKQLAMIQMEKFKPSTSSSGATSTTPVDSSTGGQADARMYMPPIYYEPKPTIMSLLLLNSRLIVAVDGGYWYDTGMEERIMSGYGQTRVIVYETESLTLDPTDKVTVLGKITPLFSRDYNGQFVAFRAIGENLHTVTTSSINTYSAVAMPVERYNYEQYGQQILTDEEYMGRVKADAEAKLIPNFVNKLTKELMQADGTLPKLARISKFLTHTSDIAPEMDQYYLYDNGILNSITLVHSMNVYSEQPATSSSAGVFFPSYSSSVYSSEEYMIMAGPGYNYSPFRMASTESTYLMAMKLDGDTASPYSVGTVEGSFLNQRSFDVVDNVLRVATTIQNFWRWAQPMPIMPAVVDPVSVAETTTSATATATGTSDTAGEPVVLETDESGIPPTLVFVDIPDPVIVADPITVPIPPMDETQSSTENYIITLKLPSEDDENHGVMQELDRLKLGKPHETFTSVRFFDNVAYAVTFQRTDPFYVLNVTNPRDLQVLAEVSITGFSSYLHSMNDENNMVLAIGQEADEFGMVLGLQISLFDVRDVKNVKVLRHTIETDPNVYSDTAGMWDVMAIRFNRETGRLIIPVDMSNWQQPSSDFHGFRVYSVTEDAIQEDEDCRVEMGNPSQFSNMCFYCASLEPRAMIVNGNMMLTKSHFVKSIDMNTCTTKWEFAVNSTYDPNTGCCSYY